MTTDITELAQSLKAAAHKAKQANDLYLEGKITLPECVIETKDYLDYSDNPNNILALVEALDYYKSREERVTSLVRDNSKSWDELYRQVEAKGKRNVELVEALEKAQQRIIELENYAEAEAAGADKVAENAVYWMKRCKELESRTVKLPDLRQIVSGDRYVWSDGVYNYSQDVKVALAAAGIKVEAE